MQLASWAIGGIQLRECVQNPLLVVGVSLDCSCCQRVVEATAILQRSAQRPENVRVGHRLIEVRKGGGVAAPLFMPRLGAALGWPRGSCPLDGAAPVGKLGKNVANDALAVLDGAAKAATAVNQPFAACISLSAHAHLGGAEALAGAENVSHGINPRTAHILHHGPPWSTLPSRNP